LSWTIWCDREGGQSEGIGLSATDETCDEIKIDSSSKRQKCWHRLAMKAKINHESRYDRAHKTEEIETQLSERLFAE
jgi:hypothetical protein